MTETSEGRTLSQSGAVDKLLDAVIVIDDLLTSDSLPSAFSSTLTVFPADVNLSPITAPHTLLITLSLWFQPIRGKSGL